MSQEIKICSDASACLTGGLSAQDTISTDKLSVACGFKKPSGTSSQFLKADGSVDSTSYTTCEGTVSTSGTIANGDFAQFNASGCLLGRSCSETRSDLGIITDLTTGPYLTGGGSSGSIEVGIDSACAASWNNAAAGGVTDVTGGDGIDSTGGTTPDISVDSTVVRTTGTQSIAGCKTFTNASVAFDGSICTREGIYHCGDSNTNICFTTDNINFCVGGVNLLNLEEDPSTQDRVIINCAGADADLQVLDASSNNLLYADAATSCVGIGTCTPVEKLTVVGSVSAQDDFKGESFIKRGGTSSQFLKADGSVDSEQYIEGVTAGGYLTGGATSGDAEVGLDSACAAKWDNASAGGVTNVTGGDGIDSTGGTTPEVSVDSTVVRTTGTQTVGGNKTFSDAVCITGGTTSTDAFCITNSDDSSDAAPVFTMKRDSASPADGDYLGQIKFKGENSSGGETVYAKVTGKVSDVTAGTEDGLIETAVQKNSTQTIVSRQTHDALKLINGTGLEVDGNILSAGSNLNTLFSNCQGTITSIGVSDGLETTGGTSPTLGIATACNTKWDQSGCAGINCVGDVTGVTAGLLLSGGGTSGSVTLGLDSGALAGFTDCTGTITTAGALLSGDATTIGVDSGALTYLDQSGCAGLNCVGDVTGIDAGTAITISDGSTATPEVAVTAACNTAWNSAKSIADALNTCPGLDCTGTLDSAGFIAANDFARFNADGDLEGRDCSQTRSDLGLGSAASCTASSLDQSTCPGLDCTGTLNSSGTIANSDFAQFNASGCLVGRSCTETRSDLGINSAADCTAAALDQSACPGIDCVGDITSVTAGLLLSGGGTTGDVTLGLDSGALTNLPTAGEKAALSGIDNFVCGAASPTGQGNVGLVRTDGSVVCTFAVGLNTSSTPTFNTVTADSGGFVKSGGTSSEFLKADGSTDSTAYTTCLGDITEVTTGPYLTGGGTAGSVEIGIDSACAAAWDNASGGSGGVTSVDSGDGLTGGPITTSGTLAVDSTVVRTTGTQTIAGCKTFSNTSVSFQDEICVRNAIRRCGDSNTGIIFTTDNINFCAGGVNLLNLEEDPSAQDRVIINCSGADADFQVLDTSSNNLFYADAATSKVGVGTCTPDEKLTVAGNLSAQGDVKATKFCGGSLTTNQATGTHSSVLGGSTNCANNNNSTIAGGANNKTVGLYYSAYNFIGAGCGNCVTGGYYGNSGIVSGKANCALAPYTLIGGGCNNSASGYYSSIVGGQLNCTTAAASVIAGGVGNCTLGSCSAVLGGACNFACGNGSAILGGTSNIIKSTHSCAMIAGQGITSLSAKMLHVNRLSVDDLPTSNPGVDSVVWKDGNVLTQGAPSWINVGRTWSFSGLPKFSKTTGATAARYDGEFAALLDTGAAASRYANAILGEGFNDISGFSGAGTDYSRALGMSIKVGYSLVGTESCKLILAFGFPATGGVYSDDDPISDYGFGLEIRRAAGSVHEWRVFGHNGTTLTASSWSSTGVTFSSDPRSLAIYSDGSGNITAYMAMYGGTDYTTITTTGGPTATSGTSLTTNHAGLRINTNASGYVTNARAKARMMGANFYSE